MNGERRLEKVRAAINETGLSAYVATRLATNSYLASVFAPWRTACIVTDRTLDLIVWEHDADRIIQDTWLPSKNVRMYAGSAEFTKTVGSLLKARGVSEERIGLDLGPPGIPRLLEGVLTGSEYEHLAQLLPNATLTDAVADIDQVMLIKEPEEIELLRTAAQIAEYGFEKGLESLIPGVRENQVAGMIEAAIRERGSEWAWADTAGTEVGSGSRTSFFKGVTQPATEKEIVSGENVILDVHTSYRLYLADLAGNAILGQPTQAQIQIRDTWKRTVDTLLAEIRPGRQISEVVKYANSIWDETGYGKYGLPMFGHGLGTSARVPPLLGMHNSSEFQAGVVMALGVHLYVPDTGGMRLEQPLLITESGCEPLCDAALDWHIIPA